MHCWVELAQPLQNQAAIKTVIVMTHCNKTYLLMLPTTRLPIGVTFLKTSKDVGLPKAEKRAQMTEEDKTAAK